MYNRYRFEYGYPYCSCYTEPDMRHLLARSKSITFNRDRFLKNSHYMGISVYTRNIRKIDVIESRYYVDKKPTYYSKVGTRITDTNSHPFFEKRGKKEVVFTTKAIFAGRDNDKREVSIRQCCDGVCYVCGCEISGPRGEYFWDEMSHGTIFSFGMTRHEVVCDDCYWDFLKIIRPWVSRETWSQSRNFPIGLEDQVAFTRFTLKKQVA